MNFITENIITFDNNINDNILNIWYDRNLYDNLSIENVFDLTFEKTITTNKFFRYLMKLKFNHPNDGEDYVARFTNCVLLLDEYDVRFKHYKIKYENIIFIKEKYIHRKKIASIILKELNN